MDREELLGIRRQLFDEYDNRVKLGEFDANSKAISLCLKSLIELTNHCLEELKKKK